jgi:hypothetical protein
MITTLCRLSYAALFEPKANPSGVLKFSCSLLIPKTDKKGMEEIRAEVKKAVERGKDKVWGGVVPKFRYEPIRDGDEELATGEKEGAEYKGMYFINCSSDTPPGVVGPDAKPLMDREAIFSGCWVRADVNPFPYKKSGNSGIGWGLNNIMLVKEDERLDGRQKAEDAFAGYATASDGGADEGALM